jgi:hypothetical protein
VALAAIQRPRQREDQKLTLLPSQITSHLSPPLCTYWQVRGCQSVPGSIIQTSLVDHFPPPVPRPVISFPLHRPHLTPPTLSSEPAALNLIITYPRHHSFRDALSISQLSSSHSYSHHSSLSCCSGIGAWLCFSRFRDGHLSRRNISVVLLGVGTVLVLSPTKRRRVASTIIPQKSREH